MLKVALAVLSVERINRLGQGERSLNGPFFPTPRARLAHVTPPTVYYILPIGGFGGQLCSRPIGFTERSY